MYSKRLIVVEKLSGRAGLFVRLLDRARLHFLVLKLVLLVDDHRVLVQFRKRRILPLAPIDNIFVVGALVEDALARLADDVQVNVHEAQFLVAADHEQMPPIPTQAHLLHDALGESLNGDDLVPFTDALPSLLESGDLI